MSRRAIFLDRDGVLIQNEVRDGQPFAITDGDAVAIIEGVRESCAALKAMGWLLVMVTNQPDVPRGRTPRAFVERTNADLALELRLDDVRVCWHDDIDQCECRKPKPGLITGAASDLGIDLATSILVGDRWRDIEAGRAAGCRTVFVDRGYTDDAGARADHTARSLSDAMGWIREQ